MRGTRITYFIRMDMKYTEKILYLPLKKKWFDMIKAGIKLEEYREMKPFWEKRFSSFDYTAVEFICGYPKKGDTERRIRFLRPSLRIGEGREEWGAERGVKYYIIDWKK